MNVKIFFSRIFKKLLKWFLWGFLLSNLYLVMCKWVMPPITLTQLGSLIEGYGLKRDYVSKEEIASSVRLAAITSEDQLFPDHDGFDWKSIQKSLQYNPNKNKKVAGAGASTITQQVAKNVFLWQGSGIGKYIRKIPESYYTKMIEWVWGKERILEVYLNIAEMGSGIFGIEAAAQSYFKKPAIKLTRQEAATIIACLPNPKIYTVKPMSRWVNWKSRKILFNIRYIESDPDVSSLVYLKKDKKEK